MRNKNGFTLVEVMVVVSLIVLLLAWGAPSYSKWKQKHDTEGQILGLYNNLQVARMTAYSRKTVTGIVWTGSGTSMSSYQVVRDESNPLEGTITDNGVDKNVLDGSLYPAGVSMSVSPDITVDPAQADTVVTFDGRGFQKDPAGAVTFSFATGNGAAIDCVVVSSTRIMTGKMNGATCTPQ